MGMKSMAPILRPSTDYRYGPELLFLRHDLQDLHAVHPRHLQVQQHQRHLVPVELDLLQGLGAVGGVQQIVAVAEHFAEDHLVDLLVLDDEDLALELQDLGALVQCEHRLGRLLLLGILPRNGAHALQQLLFLIHQVVGALKYVVEAGVLAGPVIREAA